jgi:hypothetical protein
MPPLSDVVAAFNEELLGRVAMGAGPKRNLVSSTHRGAQRAREAHFLGCTCIRRRLIVHRSVSRSLLVVQGQILVSSSILRGAVPSSG